MHKSPSSRVEIATGIVKIVKKMIVRDSDSQYPEWQITTISTMSKQIKYRQKTTMTRYWC